MKFRKGQILLVSFSTMPDYYVREIVIKLSSMLVPNTLPTHALHPIFSAY